MTRYSLSAAAGGAGAFLLALTLAACATAAGPKPASGPAGPVSPKLTASAPAPAKYTGFVGYRWTVTAISDGGSDIPIPSRYAVYLSFFQSGYFVANEPVNTHSGPYRVTADGFTTSDVATTLVGGGARDQASGLAIRAMQAFSLHPQTHAIVELHGDTMTVSENGFTLVCTRAAQAATPAPVAH